MKILFLSDGEYCDYQRDALFHGLRQRFGEHAVDYPRITSLYEMPDADRAKLYGKGFTLYGRLPEIDCDRSDVPLKIRRQYYDVVVFGSIWRSRRYLREVLRAYPKDRVAFVDGEDHTVLNSSCIGRGVYFKRELTFAPQAGIQPIHFAVPQECFLSIEALRHALRNKRHLLSPLDPRDRRTYIYDSESSYYGQYEESFFGTTMKKGGWDCLRHHEIVARGAAPYFYGLEECPPFTLHRLPRELILSLMSLVGDSPGAGESIDGERYTELMGLLVRHYETYFTTTALADYVMEHMLQPGRSSATSVALVRARESMRQGWALAMWLAARVRRGDLVRPVSRMTKKVFARMGAER